ncbi:hypothetical protein CVT25_010030 [Psilocybe cyanescens]|uniref:Uncharacterized protein n=1 Tax=Psilocybe cyanescens TaxID=93625 RepID=A0A409X3C6_PSICY|nr:hypothetical protein CVT25_010030 [Psilocybe cyanescens]
MSPRIPALLKEDLPLLFASTLHLRTFSSLLALALSKVMTHIVKNLRKNSTNYHYHVSELPGTPQMMDPLLPAAPPHLFPFLSFSRNLSFPQKKYDGRNSHADKILKSYPASSLDNRPTKSITDYRQPDKHINKTFWNPDFGSATRTLSAFSNFSKFRKSLAPLTWNLCSRSLAVCMIMLMLMLMFMTFDTGDADAGGWDSGSSTLALASASSIPQPLAALRTLRTRGVSNG